jgi:hypothetical protein
MSHRGTFFQPNVFNGLRDGVQEKLTISGDQGAQMRNAPAPVWRGQKQGGP